MYGNSNFHFKTLNSSLVLFSFSLAHHSVSWNVSIHPTEVEFSCFEEMVCKFEFKEFWTESFGLNIFHFRYFFHLKSISFQF